MLKHRSEICCLEIYAKMGNMKEKHVSLKSIRHETIFHMWHVKTHIKHVFFNLQKLYKITDYFLYCYTVHHLETKTNGTVYVVDFPVFSGISAVIVESLKRIAHICFGIFRGLSLIDRCSIIWTTFSLSKGHSNRFLAGLFTSISNSGGERSPSHLADRNCLAMEISFKLFLGRRISV
jgi:hypothetical protein